LETYHDPRWTRSVFVFNVGSGDVGVGPKGMNMGAVLAAGGAAPGSAGASSFNGSQIHATLGPHMADDQRPLSTSSTPGKCLHLRPRAHRMVERMPPLTGPGRRNVLFIGHAIRAFRYTSTFPIGPSSPARGTINSVLLRGFEALCTGRARDRAGLSGRGRKRLKHRFENGFSSFQEAVLIPGQIRCYQSAGRRIGGHVLEELGRDGAAVEKGFGGPHERPRAHDRARPYPRSIMGNSWGKTYHKGAAAGGPLGGPRLHCGLLGGVHTTSLQRVWRP